MASQRVRQDWVTNTFMKWIILLAWLYRFNSGVTVVFPFYRWENLKLKKRTPQAQGQLVSSAILGTIPCHLSFMSFWWHLFDFFTDIKFFLLVLGIVTQRSPWDLPGPGIKPRSPALQADSLPSQPDWQKLGIKLIMLPQSSMRSLLLLKLALL